MRHIEISRVDSRGFVNSIGIGACWPSENETLSAFEILRSVARDITKIQYLADLRDVDDRIIDTIPVSMANFVKIAR